MDGNVTPEDWAEIQKEMRKVMIKKPIAELGAENVRLHDPKDGWPFYACSGGCESCHMDVAVHQGRLYCYDCLDEIEARGDDIAAFVPAHKKRIAEQDAEIARLREQINEALKTVKYAKQQLHRDEGGNWLPTVFANLESAVEQLEALQEGKG